MSSRVHDGCCHTRMWLLAAFNRYWLVPYKIRVQTKILFKITRKTCKMGFEIAVFNKIHFAWQESLLTSLHPSPGLFPVFNSINNHFISILIEWIIEIFTDRDCSVTVLQSAFKTKFASEIFNMARLIMKIYHILCTSSMYDQGQ